MEEVSEIIDERFRISTAVINEYFYGRRDASFEEYYAFLEWRKENKKRGA